MTLTRSALSFASSLGKAARDAVSRISFPQQWHWMQSLLPNTRINFAEMVGDGLGSNVFMAPILWLWRASLEARLVLITEDNEQNEKMDFKSELVKLLNSPNPFVSWPAMLLAIFISWFTDGNAYLLKARDGTGKVRQLWFVPHWMIEPKHDESDPHSFISHYEYVPGGAVRQDLNPREVVHLKMGMDPRNIRKGLSYMKLLLREIFNDDEAANFVAALLLNGGVPGVIISPKDNATVDAEALKATKDYISVNFGRSKRGAPLALGSPTEVKEFGYDPQKMNLGVVRNVSEERTCAALGLPAAVVGFGSGMEQTSVGATLVELHRIAWIGGVIPNQDLLAAELTRNLREDFALADNMRLGWDRRKVRALQDDLNKEAQRLDQGIRGGWVMVSEGRQALNLPVEDEHEIFLRGIGTVAEGPGAPEPEPVDPALDPNADPNAEPELDENGKPKKPVAPPKDKPKAARRRLSKQQAQIIQAMDKLKGKAAKRMEQRMGDFFKRYGEAAAEAFLAATAKGSEDELWVELMFGSLNTQKFRQELRGLYGAHYVSVYKESQQLLAGIGLAINVPDSVELRILASGGTKAGLVDLTKSAREKALKIIEAGRAEGRNPHDIARDLAEAVPAGRFKDARTRAEVIARTETRVAQTESAMLMYRHTDGIDRVMVIDNRTGFDDDDCIEANGQVVSFEDADALLAAEHPNGTRDVVPMFGGA